MLENYSELTKNLLNKKSYNYEDLITIMNILRSENGCPWDRAQTHESLRANLLEESYELLEAINNNNPSMMKEELGDFLLQFVFHVNIAEDNGEFTANEVITELCTKLIERHTHIFGKDFAKDDKEALAVWEKNKTKNYQSNKQVDYLDKLPKGMSALMKAQKMQKRAEKIGFDWGGLNQGFDKINEEIAEVKQAIINGDKIDITRELGDLLFSVVNVCRQLDVDAEVTLTSTTDKLTKRFHYIEDKLTEEHLSCQQASMERKEELWQESKKGLK